MKKLKKLRKKLKASLKVLKARLKFLEDCLDRAEQSLNIRQVRLYEDKIQWLSKDISEVKLKIQKNEKKTGNNKKEIN